MGGDNNGSLVELNDNSNFTIPSFMMNDDEYYRFRLVEWYFAFVSIAIAFLGIIGNVMSAIVLVKQRKNTSTQVYLISLSICDTLVLFFTLLLLLVQSKEKPNYDYTLDHQAVAYVRLFPIVHSLTLNFQVISVWQTVSFTVDRFLMICVPFQGERFCKKSMAIKVTLILYALGFLYGIPRFFEYTAQSKTIPAGNSSNTTITMMQVTMTKYGESSLSLILVHLCGYFVVHGGIPFIILAVLNGLLLREVHKLRKSAIQIQKQQQSRRLDTTIMLIGVVLIFLVCQIPALVTNIILAVDSDYAFFAFFPSVLNEVTNLLVTLNSAINIVPYYVFSKEFRSTFKAIYCCGKLPTMSELESRRLSYYYAGNNSDQGSMAVTGSRRKVSSARLGLNRVEGSHSNSSENNAVNHEDGEIALVHFQD